MTAFLHSLKAPGYVAAGGNFTSCRKEYYGNPVVNWDNLPTYREKSSIIIFLIDLFSSAMKIKNDIKLQTLSERENANKLYLR